MNALMTTVAFLICFGPALGVLAWGVRYCWLARRRHKEFMQRMVQAHAQREAGDLQAYYRILSKLKSKL